VKELSQGDHESLLEMTDSLCKRILEKRSFLVRFYLHFCDITSGRYYAAMNNVFHAEGIKEKIVWKYLFDLKGSRDDKLITEDGKRIHEVHRRWYLCYNCWYCCDCCCSDTCCYDCIPEERTRYYAGKRFAFNGKLHLTSKQRDEFSDTLKRDVDYLRERQVMDYSLLVGVQAFDSMEDAKRAGVTLNDFACNITDSKSGKKMVYVYYMGIVDFFQKWNFAKTIANVLKSCCAPHPLSTVRPEKYAQQFETHLLNKFTSNARELSDQSIGHIETKLEIKGENTPVVCSIRGSVSKDTTSLRAAKPLNPPISSPPDTTDEPNDSQQAS